MKCGGGTAPVRTIRYFPEEKIPAAGSGFAGWAPSRRRCRWMGLHWLQIRVAPSLRRSSSRCSRLNGFLVQAVSRLSFPLVPLKAEPAWNGVGRDSVEPDQHRLVGTLAPPLEPRSS